MINAQKGFAALEFILVVMIIAALGGVGYYVYNSSNKTKAVLSSADATSASAVDAKPDVNKKTFTSKDFHISFQYPKNWVVKDDSTTFDSHPLNLTADITADNSVTASIFSVTGIGGECQPAKTDVPFQVNNKCSTFDITGSTKTATDYILQTRLGEPDGTSTYQYCIQPLNATTKIVLNSPTMGLDYPCNPNNLNVSTTGVDNSTSSFFTDPDLSQLRDLLMSVKYSPPKLPG